MQDQVWWIDSLLSSGFGMINLSNSIEFRLACGSNCERYHRAKEVVSFSQDFGNGLPLQTAGINALSSFLADDLSAVLDAKLSPGTMIPRSKLPEFLVSQEVPPLNLESVSIASGAAAKLGTNEIITGELSFSDEALELILTL